MVFLFGFGVKSHLEKIIHSSHHHHHHLYGFSFWNWCEIPFGKKSSFPLIIIIIIIYMVFLFGIGVKSHLEKSSIPLIIIVIGIVLPSGLGVKDKVG
jgi:hypothetical protein